MSVTSGVVSRIEVRSSQPTANQPAASKPANSQKTGSS
jgi:hypothetical protein